MIRTIKTKTTREFNQLCIEALQKSAFFLIFDKPAYLHFTKTSAGNETTKSSHGKLVYNYNSRTLETVITGIKLPNKDDACDLRFDADNSLLQQLSQKEIPALLSQGYVIDAGEIILYKYLPTANRVAGAGYNYIPDEDEYEETILRFKQCELEIELQEVPAEIKEKISEWFSHLREKYNCIL